MGLVIGFAGRKADPAIAHDQRGNAVIGGGAAQGVPGRLAIHVRVHVHPSGGQQFALCVNFPVAAGAHFSHRRDPAILDGYVAAEAGFARTVDYHCIADYQIVHVLCLAS